MKRMLLAATIAILLGVVSPALAHMGPPEGDGTTIGSGPSFRPPAFLRLLFPPRVVMEHQQAIGLRPAQVDAIKRAMNDAQQRLTDIQWQLDAESEALGKLLGSDHVDEAAVLAKLERVTTIEQEVKKVNFTLLVRIKNQLDAEQQEKLRALRPAGGGAPAGAPPGGAPPGGAPPPPD